MSDAAYKDFTNRLRLLIKKRPSLIVTTLSNIFTMRLIGNKTHGDLAEIAIAEFINQYMYEFQSVHVGKDLFRAKSKEEDITIHNDITKVNFPVSLKAYGDGPLQLSTDKNFQIYPLLSGYGEKIENPKIIDEVFQSPALAQFDEMNVLPLIYDEKNHRCNILVFDGIKAKSSTALIQKESAGSGRKHPVYKFYDASNNYICEVRYGNATANALQRGLWTHTKNALSFFDSITDGWIDYAHNHTLVQLFSHALVASETGHTDALRIIATDIEKLKNGKE